MGRVRVTGADSGVAAAPPPGTADPGLGGAAPQPALQRGGVARERLERGLRAWSSPTFTVFTHVCLRAERAIGRLELGRGGPAREPRKSRAILGLCLSEWGG